MGRGKSLDFRLLTILRPYFECVYHLGLVCRPCGHISRDYYVCLEKICTVSFQLEIGCVSVSFPIASIHGGSFCVQVQFCCLGTVWLTYVLQWEPAGCPAGPVTVVGVMQLEIVSLVIDVHMQVCEIRTFRAVE